MKRCLMPYSRICMRISNKKSQNWPISKFCDFFFIHTTIAGFSTITFYAYGREIPVHGFLQREVRAMKRLVKERG